MIYLDASVVVSAITNEQHTSDALRWIGRQAADDLCISQWVSTEVASALSLKVRRGQLPVDEKMTAWGGYRRMIDDGLQILPIRDVHFQSANEMIWNWPDGLRAGDALHLAVARDFGVSVCTLDDVMLESGPTLGLRTLSPLLQ